MVDSLFNGDLIVVEFVISLTLSNPVAFGQGMPFDVNVPRKGHSLISETKHFSVPHFC